MCLLGERYDYHKEKRDLIESKNRVIKQLNITIGHLNNRIALFDTEHTDMIKAVKTHVYQVIKDHGTHYEVLTIIRVSQTEIGTEILVQ